MNAPFIQIDTREIERAIRDLGEPLRRQVEFAAAVGLTKTGRALAGVLSDTMSSVFDSPKPSIVKGTFSTPATRAKLETEVGVRDKKTASGFAPADYVGEHFSGAARPQKPYERALQSMGVLPDGWRAVPGEDLKLDRYGNPSRKDLAEVFGALKSRMSVYKGRGKKAARYGYFIVAPGSADPRTRHLIPGIWRRRETYATGSYNDRPAIAVFIFVRHADYTKRIDLPRLAREVVEREFSAHFAAALDSAIRTAR